MGKKQASSNEAKKLAVFANLYSDNGIAPPSNPFAHFGSVHDNKQSHYYTENTNKYSSVKTGTYRFKGPSVKDRLALVMMIKNEEKRIEVSYDSVKNVCDTFVILDTGSTDRTIEITREYCKNNNITLHLKQLPFVNFEKSRNDLLDFADEALAHHYFMLLLDCNDELRNHSELVGFIESYTNGKTQTGFHLRQQWWTGHSLDTYFNIRMTISHFGWRFKGVVHEYICRSVGKDGPVDILKLDNVILFQDRTKDDNKSQLRFKRDKDLLYAEYLRNPTDPRTLFYLAQTCSCLGQLQEAYEYNLLRTKYEGFLEEVFHAYYRLGGLALRMNHPWEECLGWYLKAYSHSKRVEPLVSIAEYYLTRDAFGKPTKDYHLAFTFINEACKLNYPHQQILFIDKQKYQQRWSLMGQIGFYVNRFTEGKDGCIKALTYGEDANEMNNLLMYLRREQQLAQQGKFGGEIQGVDPMMSISLNPTNKLNDDINPPNEAGLGFGTALTPEEVMKKALAKMK